MTFTNKDISWIRSNMADSEQTKTVNDAVLSFMQERKLFKLIVPETLGGAMRSLPEAIRTFQIASSINGSFGWLVTIGSGGGMFAPNFTEEAAKTYYTPKEAVIAGSGFPAGTAQKVDDGYIVNGEWLYCSGAQYASIFTATCKVEPSQAQPTFLSFIFEREQVDVIEDWNAIGLKATSSHTIRVKDQFVPEERTFSIFKKQFDVGDKIYDFPFLMFSEASFTSIVLGIGKHFFQEVDNILQEKTSSWNTERLAFVEDLKKRESQQFFEAESLFYQQLNDAWNKHTRGEPLSAKEQQSFSLCSKKVVTTILASANTFFRVIGMQAVKEDTTINQIWRDLHTAAQHAFLTPQTEDELKLFID
ncbi:acyl-CoA dehydrogenase [Bacillaceae bacterium SIJ1]|uniref:acyl-CoA dehydrogenase n=1 Tax=Litoribacterium kuwaitense TaxID=1398745 RepID=UPI0013ECCCDE|nr:acyl-CoA dehydrogenase [Litoribacterium kuwaitense]NGP44798.1 acyl-CoA dehydrogenase [Litoribacterium kuwaitense]